MNFTECKSWLPGEVVGNFSDAVYSVGEGFGVASGFGLDGGCFSFQEVEHVGAFLVGSHKAQFFAGSDCARMVVGEHVVVTEVGPSGGCFLAHDRGFEAVGIDAVDVL